MADTAPSLHQSAEVEPAIRQLGFGDLNHALREGWADFMAVPTQLLFLALLYPAVLFIGAHAAQGGLILPLVFPLVAGLALMGPVLALGLYEISRRREQGLPVSWRNALDPFRSPALSGIMALGVLLLLFFVLWIVSARAIFALTVGTLRPESIGAFIETVQASPALWQLVIVGNLVGAMFAVVVLTLSVVSFPMLLDRNVGPLVAMRTSMQVVLRNPIVMAAWGVTVAVVLALGSLPLFVGLAVAVPVLGHATWHLYRRAVAY